MGCFLGTSCVFPSRAHSLPRQLQPGGKAAWPTGSPTPSLQSPLGSRKLFSLRERRRRGHRVGGEVALLPSACGRSGSPQSSTLSQVTGAEGPGRPHWQVQASRGSSKTEAGLDPGCLEPGDRWQHGAAGMRPRLSGLSLGRARWRLKTGADANGKGLYNSAWLQLTLCKQQPRAQCGQASRSQPASRSRSKAECCSSQQCKGAPSPRPHHHQRTRQKKARVRQ